ncbi:MAG: hypothetical protein JEZ09_12235 [Salinivirgaceae bacterium]|nr:hypothetical protein [Salinivirgaceae bacterium]
MKNYLRIIGLLLIPIINNAQIKDSISTDLKSLYLEYQLYQTVDSNLKCELLMNKALYLKSKGQFNEACEHLQRAKNYQKTTTFNLQYELALNLYLAYRYGEAYNIYNDLSDSLKILNPNSQTLWLLLNLETQSFETTKDRIKILTSGSNDIEIEKLPISYTYKSPVKAKKLSSFIPGLGQLYTGNTLKGIMSFSLNAGALILGAYEMLNGCYIAGTFAGIYPFLRFYNGGKNLSYHLAIDYNESKERKIKAQYQKVILKANK